MPVVTDSRGVTVYVDDDQARHYAQQLLDGLEAKLARTDRFSDELNEDDSERVRSDFLEAERLVTEVGDLEPVDHVILPPKPVHVPPPDHAEEQRRRQERDRRILELYAQYVALGQQDDDDGSQRFGSGGALQEARSQKIGCAEPQHKEAVGVRRDRERERWVVYGRGPELRLASQEAAEAEAKRRAGWT
jgi:hypothetical protein